MAPAFSSETIQTSQAQPQAFTLQNSRKTSREISFLPPHRKIYFIPSYTNSLSPWGWGLSDPWYLYGNKIYLHTF